MLFAPFAVTPLVGCCHVTAASIPGPPPPPFRNEPAHARTHFHTNTIVSRILYRRTHYTLPRTDTRTRTQYTCVTPAASITARHFASPLSFIVARPAFCNFILYNKSFFALVPKCMLHYYCRLLCNDNKYRLPLSPVCSVYKK